MNLAILKALGYCLWALLSSLQCSYTIPDLEVPVTLCESASSRTESSRMGTLLIPWWRVWDDLERVWKGKIRHILPFDICHDIPWQIYAKYRYQAVLPLWQLSYNFACFCTKLASKGSILERSEDFSDTFLGIFSHRDTQFPPRGRLIGHMWSTMMCSTWTLKPAWLSCADGHSPEWPGVGYHNLDLR